MKIRLDRTKCIGCGSCSAICPKHFEMADDGKSHLKGLDRADIEELQVQKVDCAESAAEMCPVQCIKVDKKKE